MEPIDIEDLLIRSLQGRTGRDEDRTLDRWRAADSENEAQYQLLSGTWRMTAHYDPHRWEGEPPVRDVLRAAADTQLSRARGPLRRSVLVAALVIVSFGGGYAISRWNGGTGPSAPAPLGQIVSTGDSERATVTLSDGTAVRLGARTTLRLIRMGSHVEVWLEGRAFFGVHPDSTRTFTVRTEHGTAAALGTRFEVRTEGDELQVAVLQGDVRVSSGGAAVELGEGQLSRSIAGVPTPSIQILGAEELLNRLDWMGPVLVFRRTPLERAITEIAHRYRANVALGDDRLAQVPVTGILTDLPVDGAVRVICAIVEASCVREGDGFLIGSSSPATPGAFEG